MRVVVDTNVIVSSLLKEESVSNHAIRLIFDCAIFLAIDERIWEEYDEVTLHPHLRIHPTTRANRLSALRAISELVSTHPLDIPAGEVIDSKDLPFAEVAVAARAKYLVTGNKKHFAFMQRFDVSVLSPAEFIEQMRDED
jgi:putative PIN family toxin of toxin-antitoxin system